MKPVARILATIGLALALAFSQGGIANATTGGVNVAGWCNTQFWNGGSASYWTYSNPYSWYCYSSDHSQSRNVDMNAACAFTYPGHPGSARLGAYNVYGWYCVY